ncbi:MAG: S9 family peptidase, partial [Bacteroidetes bacterium]
EETRFARVGGEITALRVGVVDAGGTETRWLSIPVPREGFYLGEVNWAGNSNELLVEKLGRFRDHREFLLADVTGGTVTTLFEESDPAWVVASYNKNGGLYWIRDHGAFLVLSEKDGWRHAYVCSRDGREERLLTPGAFDIIDRVAVDQRNGWFYYMASPANGTQKYLYRVPVDGSGNPERVTPVDQPGTHSYSIAPGAKWAIHTWSNINTPPVTELVRLPGHTVVRVLEDNRELREKVASLDYSPTEFLQLDIGEGIVLDAWMIKPHDFGPSRKYPVFVYVYGEPHGQTVLDSWGNAMNDYHRVVADLGYLVVSVDNRGTPCPKGAAWRRAIAGKLGPLSTEEQAAALKELGRTRPYVDLSRTGIWGWSGGGSNTLNAMFRKPEVYNVGIAVAPKPQPHLYNAWFQEIYMKNPEVNPDGYRESAPINYAGGLKGNLLIVHGTGETNTHLQITEGLVDRLIELGKPFDYMAYPNRDHGIREGEGTSLHLRMLMVRYLLMHLPPGPR